MSDNIIPLRRTARPEPIVKSDNIRGVAPIPAEHLRAIFDLKPIELHRFKPVHIELRRAASLGERIMDAIGSEFGFGFYCGVWAGALFTVIAAYFVAFVR